MKAIETWFFMKKTFLNFEDFPDRTKYIQVEGVTYDVEYVYDTPFCICVDGEHNFKDKEIIFVNDERFMEDYLDDNVKVPDYINVMSDKELDIEIARLEKEAERKR